MKKTVTLFFALLFLASCNKQPTSKEGADGYRFGKPQYEKTEVVIRVVKYKTSKDLQAEITKHGVSVADSKNIAAFSILRAPFDVCTIHMIDPAVSYQPEYVGHEFLHCVYGQWHTNNDSKS